MKQFSTKPKFVVLHCSDTGDKQPGEKGFDRVGLSQIRNYHITKPPHGRGWDDVGYHMIVRQSGVIELGRPTEFQGAHAKGFNDQSLGICYVGTKRPTAAQLESLGNLAVAIFSSHGITPDNWMGHYELTEYKTCPGVSMELFKEFLRGVFRQKNINC